MLFVCQVPFETLTRSHHTDELVRKCESVFSMPSAMCRIVVGWREKCPGLDRRLLFSRGRNALILEPGLTWYLGVIQEEESRRRTTFPERSDEFRGRAADLKLGLWNTIVMYLTDGKQKKKCSFSWIVFIFFIFCVYNHWCSSQSQAKTHNLLLGIKVKLPVF